MGMSNDKNLGKRRRLLAVATIFGLSAVTGQVSSAESNEDFSSESFHVSSTNAVVAPGQNIFLSEEGAAAVIVDGSENLIVIPRGMAITSSGQFGRGILISSGQGHTLNVDGNVYAAGNGVEFNFGGAGLSGALVNNFNLSGILAGGNCAIYIGENSFVRNININDGAEIFGNIISNWSALDSGNYLPERVTNLNVNTNFAFDGNISGAESIKLHIRNGAMKFSGTAEVLSVDVGLGAKLFGGTFNLHNVGEAAGTFINHGTIGAASPDTNLIINGDLISDGVLQKVSGGSAGSIIVKGVANVEGSTVTTDSLLPNETATVLVAESITGNIKNNKNNPVPISAMLTATGEIVGNTLTVTTHEANNTFAFDFKEAETFGAMNKMFEKLEDKKQQDEMRKFYNLAPPEAKRTLEEIGSNDAAQIMSVAQQSTAVDSMISSRVSKVFAPDFVDVNIHPMKLADGEDDSPEMSIKVEVPSSQENNLWLNYMKNWGSLRGGTDYHGSVIVGGYDRPFGRNFRAGIFATYGTIGYGAKSSRATVYDTRLGLYAGWHNRQSDVYFYVNGGQLRNSLHRGISSLGLTTRANYKSRIIEIGGEYKYNLTPKKAWNISPFVNFQASHLKQNSYHEHGAGIYNQHVESNSNTYFAAQTGIDFKRYYQTGMFGFRFGVKHGFTGADPDLRISYEGDGSSNYRLRNERDKTHFVFSVRGESEFARGWFVGGEAELQRGKNDKDVTASIMLRRTW
ncbi:MAG: autotransporter outer membrane beta-barrel domain-containing protein [Selenomonadaceae bacterium]|nr:autotransporter outer membrane beta-barrel domain-containing protein [Selenomonadaceae bacterium]